jgi:hypothetical protein
MTDRRESRNVPADAVIREIARAVETLEFGVVTIKVHHGKITQVEITEKRRFNEALDFEKGSGI